MVVAQFTSYIQSNWVSIVATIVLTSVGVWGTQRYIKREVASAKRERYDKAKEELLKVIESQVINQEKDLSVTRMSYLIKAAERKHSTSVSDKLTKVEILQDVLLKIESSPHLAGDKKQAYSDYLDHKVDKIKRKKQTSSLMKHQSQIIDELKENISNGNTDTALEIIKELEERSERNKTSEEPSVEIRFGDALQFLVTSPTSDVQNDYNTRQVFYRLILLLMVYVTLSYIILSGGLLVI